MSENKILTPKIVKHFSTAFSYGGHFQAHLFSWNSAKQRPELVRCKWRKFLWAVNFVGSMVYYMFVLGRFFQTCVFGSASKEQMIYMFFILVFYTFIPMLHSNFIVNRREFPVCIASTMEYLESVEEQYDEIGAKPPKQIKTVEKMLDLLYVAFSFNVMLMVIVSIVHPLSPEFFTSVILPRIPEELSELQIVVRIWSSTFHAWVMYVYYSHCYLGAFSVLSTLTVLLAFTDELSIKTCRLTESSLRQSSNKVLAWKALQILVAEMNNALNIGIAGTKVLLIFYAVFCTYGAIKFDGLLAVGLGFIGTDATAFLVLLFTLLYGMHEKTVDTLVNWKSEMARAGGFHVSTCKSKSKMFSSDANSLSQELVLFRKHLRSIKPLSFTVNGMYRIDKEMVLTMFLFILESTVNFILMYR